MWTYQYKHGDRPLEGYTIQRAAGRGGFGEVYYATSDSGREVALKAVHGYEQIELRGISQCMNLKSPHLVSIFDVKHNEQGRPFVIMEFVDGPSLRGLLDESPSGLGEQKSAFFLREIAKGLTFLHDCGIVHRDLKPGNIFYENGYVKIGDYGLSKAITVGQTSQQTVTVGTVHYMAPEIGAGRYDRSIDIYAMGAVLFEMLTGTVPFVGASPSEILMKHLSAEPDCKGISEPFATVIKKAMHKDPTRRYQSVQEMVEAVFGAEHVRNSMSVFAAEELSVVAGRVAQRITTAGSPTPKATESSSVVGNTPIHGRTMWDRMSQRFDRAGDRVAQLGEGLFAGQKLDNSPLNFDELNERDSMTKRDRRLLAVFVSLVIALAAGVMASGSHGAPVGYAIAMFCTTWGATLGICASWRWMMPKMANDSPGAKRFAAAMLAMGGAVGFSAVNWLVIGQGPMIGTWIAVIITFLANDSRQWIDPWRSDRVRMKFAVQSAFCAWIASMFFQGSSSLAVAVVAGTALMVQVLTPWDAKGAEERRNAGKRGFDVIPTPPTPPTPPVPRNVGFGERGAQAFAVANTQGDYNVTADTSSQPAFASRVPPRWMRVACMILFAGMFTGGVMLLIGASNRAFAPHADEEAMARGFGIGLIIAGACALVRSMIGRYVSFFQFIIRPTLLLLCFESIVISSIITSSTPNMQGDEKMIGMFFMIFPAVLFVTILLISWQF
ncbi:MAG: serine/threonine protein kinase, partial [Anaerolineae bacterium]|nr:serine/threonine protein kinase [Phycisphaerae bacterium]